MNWVTAGTPAGEDPETGYPIPAAPGEQKSVPCRFHLGGTKVFRNEDSNQINQIGKIRLDAGVDLPEVGQMIEVVGQFKGKVQDIYRGQLSYRIDV
jgi:hypothetical protein